MPLSPCPSFQISFYHGGKKIMAFFTTEEKSLSVLQTIVICSTRVIVLTATSYSCLLYYSNIQLVSTNEPSIFLCTNLTLICDVKDISYTFQLLSYVGFFHQRFLLCDIIIYIYIFCNSLYKATLLTYFFIS